MNSPKVRKKEEFKAFIKFLEEGTDAHWIQVAEALGVDKDTITEWKKYPEAKAAIERGINYAMKKMQKVGGRDWRMWESKLKMLKISPLEKGDLTSDGEPLVGPVIFKPKKSNE